MDLLSIGKKYFSANGSGAKEKWKIAFGLFQGSVFAGDDRGHIYLGIAYELGRGVRANSRKALIHYKAAAKAGLVEGLRRAGNLLLIGPKTIRNKEAGIETLRLAGKLGDRQSKSMLKKFER